jgi:hypothetical protein
MDIDDEVNGRIEGEVLKKLLDFCEVPNEYHYVRTISEFKKKVELFKQSGFLCFHLSCHANKSVLGLTTEPLDFETFEEVFGETSYHRRIFLSACSAANFNLAKHFIPKYHCYSLIGSPIPIGISKAAALEYFLLSYVSGESARNASKRFETNFE